ncbi:MAG: nucleoside hydrolase [Acidimicrobiales bacterium]
MTTSIDPGGRRAGYVRSTLRAARREDVPVAAGAAVSMTTLVTPGGFPDEARRWPDPPPPAPSPAGSASRLLAESVDAGATIVAIGPFTNLALLGVERPDVLARAEVVVMGGLVRPGLRRTAALRPGLRLERPVRHHRRRHRRPSGR